MIDSKQNIYYDVFIIHLTSIFNINKVKKNLWEIIQFVQQTLTIQSSLELNVIVLKKKRWITNTLQSLPSGF